MSEDGGEIFTVDVLPVEDLGSVEEYDAVVLGSAVYAGHWLKDAREMAEREWGREISAALKDQAV